MTKELAFHADRELGLSFILGFTDIDAAKRYAFIKNVCSDVFCFVFYNVISHEHTTDGLLLLHDSGNDLHCRSSFNDHIVDQCTLKHVHLLRFLL